MKNNYPKVKKAVYEIVRESAYSKNNHFTETVWVYHILPVVRHALSLGKKLKADLEILEIASLLHDYAALKDFKYYKKHHIYGAKFAGAILKDLDYPKAKIAKVQECILCHRGSVPLSRRTVEAKILASADAMAHVTEVADIFFLAYNVHGLETYEGCEWIKGKLSRSWNKIMPEGRDLVKTEYEIFLNIINKAIKAGRAEKI